MRYVALHGQQGRRLTQAESAASARIAARVSSALTIQLTQRGHNKMVCGVPFWLAIDRVNHCDSLSS
jgi:hypothetical protein